jgi:hypothetical protein
MGVYRGFRKSIAREDSDETHPREHGGGTAKAADPQHFFNVLHRPLIDTS